MIDNVQFLGHGTILIQSNPIIYINPWRITLGVFHADVILISDDQYDHCSAIDVNKLRGPHTRIISDEAVQREIPDTTILRPWHSITVDRASIKAIPAYDRAAEQTRERSGLGFVISVQYHDIYYAGNTVLTTEMARIQPDIAILPIDGKNALSVEEAVEAVKILRPKWVIPCHWGNGIDGATRADALQFHKLVGERAKVILPD